MAAAASSSANCVAMLLQASASSRLLHPSRTHPFCPSLVPASSLCRGLNHPVSASQKQDTPLVTKGSGFVWFLLVAPVFIWATFVPIFGHGESPDSRKAGPFNAKAERWNGRAAMIGFVSLILTEQLLLKGSALLGFLHR